MDQGTPQSFAPVPSTLLGQVRDSINSNQPALNQVSSSSPTFSPDLQPAPTVPLPDKSPIDLIHKDAMQMPKTPLHRAFERRGMQPPAQIGGSITMPTTTDVNQRQAGVQIPISEAEKIVNTLSDRLRVLSDHEKAGRKALLPQGVA